MVVLPSAVVLSVVLPYVWFSMLCGSVSCVAKSSVCFSLLCVFSLLFDSVCCDVQLCVWCSILFLQPAKCLTNTSPPVKLK